MVSVMWHGTSQEDDAVSMMGGKPRMRSGTNREHRNSRERSRSRNRGEREEDRPRVEPSSPPPWRRTASSRPERSWRHGTASSPSGTTTELTDIQRTLAFNRLTWRCILGIEEEGPGTDLDRIVPQPLDLAQAQNIAATVQDMTMENRLAFATSFFRYAFELCHQVMQIIVTGHEGNPEQIVPGQEFDGMSLLQRPHDDQEEPDGLGLVQTQVAAKLSSKIQALQQALDRVPGATDYRAGWLLRQIESRYLGVLEWSLWHPQIQDLQAMLTTYADGNLALPEHPPTEADDAWALCWWKDLRPLILRIDRGNSLLAGTALVPSRSPTPEPEIVDTLQPMSSRGDADTQALRAQADDLNQEREAETEYLASVYDALENEKESRKWKDWDDWALHDELHARQPPSKDAEFKSRQPRAVPVPPVWCTFRSHCQYPDYP